MWWVGVHLPALSLESFVATFPEAPAPDDAVLLLYRQRVVSANDAARARGIQPGQRRATAMSLAPQARCGEADDRRDAAALQAVAHAMLAFTPSVSLGAVDTALAEVSASLRLFGGLPRLLQRLRQVLAPLGHQLQVAVAPTPQAAAWLASWRDDAQATGPLPRTAADWRACLDAVPLRRVAAAAPHLAALEALGLHAVADVRRQPRAGLARRFGAALLDELDAAAGDRADPRVPLQPPPEFDSRLELFQRAEAADALLAGASILLARLVAWAQAQHGRIAACRLTLHPETRRSLRDDADGGLTVLHLELASPMADVAHLQVLLRERLQRLPLAAPVIEISLHCSQLVPGAPPNEELFPSAASAREGWQRLLERLEARLGPEQVQQLEAVADHRPERATRACAGSAAAAAGVPARRPRSATAPAHALPHVPTNAPATAPATPPADPPRQRRPAWLLCPPQPLVERGGVPCLDGRPLVLLGGPERIESGWWDGDLVARDYFIAQADDGTLLWVYRFRHAPEGREAGWHLHGRFG